MVTLVYGRPYAADRGMLRGGEMFTLTLFALLGMFVMISGSNFLVIYLGPRAADAVAATRWWRCAATTRVATEAAMKYFVLGALASGFLLYGMSMIYGATGSLDINEVFKAIAQPARSTTRCWCSAWCSSSPAWPSSSAPCRSTCGCPTSTRARRPRHAADRRGARARRLRDHHPPAGRRPAAAGDRLAADADRAGRRRRCWSATWRPSRRPT